MPLWVTAADWHLLRKFGPEYVINVLPYRVHVGEMTVFGKTYRLYSSADRVGLECVRTG